MHLCTTIQNNIENMRKQNTYQFIKEFTIKNTHITYIIYRLAKLHKQIIHMLFIDSLCS